MPKVVHELQQDEFTIPASASIKPQTQPTIQFERKTDASGNPIYELTLKIVIIPEQENLNSTPTRISPSGISYAVLKAKKLHICDTGKVEMRLSAIQLGSPDEFEIEMDLEMVIAGSKGDHGN